jgi:transcriptional regulator with XRE-family HTH domain
MPASDFTAVSERLAAMGISLGDIAQHFGVRRETVSRWRRAGGEFPPPEGWREALAKLAEARSEQLRDYAQELKPSR